MRVIIDKKKKKKIRKRTIRKRRTKKRTTKKKTIYIMHISINIKQRRETEKLVRDNSTGVLLLL